MTWKALPAINEKDMHIGCPTCSPVTHKLEMGRVLAVGFGDVSVMRGRECVYAETEFNHANPEAEETMRGYPCAQEFEDMAAKDPDHDWRISFYSPLHEEEYQRHGPDEWVMVSSGPGFA